MIVKQAAHVLDLLEFFARSKRPATLSEIADEFGWPRSSTFNLVGTLAERGFLYEPRVRAGYYPSPRWLSAARAIAEAEPLPEAIYALTTEVARETGETTAIIAPAGTSVVFLHVVESEAAIRYTVATGHRVPIHATASGRAVLAQYSKSERDSLLRKVKFERHTSSTLVSVEEVEAELKRAAERGWHQSIEGYSPDLAGVAVPLPMNDRRLSIVVGAPVFRVIDRIPEIAAIMQRAIKRHAADLGHPPTR